MGIIFPLGFLCQRAAEPGASHGMPAGALPAHCQPGKAVSNPLCFQQPGENEVVQLRENRIPHGDCLVKEVQKRTQTSIPSRPQGCWLHSHPSSSLGTGAAAGWSLCSTTSPHLSTEHIHVCWREAGGPVGVLGHRQQADPASTMVWLLLGEGVHPCSYSTVTASGQISVPF